MQQLQKTPLALRGWHVFPGAPFGPLHEKCACAENHQNSEPSMHDVLRFVPHESCISPL